MTPKDRLQRDYRRGLAHRAAQKEAHDLACDERDSSYPRWIMKLIDRIAEAEAALAEKTRECEELKRKLFLIFDNSCYSDSYGVEGSSFSVCRWCSGGSGPGGTAPFRHKPRCLLDDDQLEKKVADVWGDWDEISKENDALKAQLEQLRKQVAAR